MSVEVAFNEELSTVVTTLGAGSLNLSVDFIETLEPTFGFSFDSASNVFVNLSNELIPSIVTTTRMVIQTGVILGTITPSITTVYQYINNVGINIEYLIRPHFNVVGHILLDINSNIETLNIVKKDERLELLKEDVSNDLTLIKDKLNEINTITRNTKNKDESSMFHIGLEAKLDYPYFLQLVNISLTVCEDIKPDIVAQGFKDVPEFDFVESIEPVVTSVGCMSGIRFNETINSNITTLGEGSRSEVYTLFGYIEPTITTLFDVAVGVSISFDETITNNVTCLGEGSLDTLISFVEVVEPTVYTPNYLYQDDYYFNILGNIESSISSLGQGSLVIAYDFSNTITSSIVTSFNYQLDELITFNETIVPVANTFGEGSLQIVNNFYEDIGNTVSVSGLGALDRYIDIIENINMSFNTSGIGALVQSISIDEVINPSFNASGIGALVQSISIDEVINPSFNASGIGEEDPDIQDPIITLFGSTSITLDLGDTYTEPGYSASDNYDGDITDDVVVTGSVNTNSVGSYTLYYNVEDAAGNTDQRTRTVYVEDNTPPSISLIGSSTITISQGDVFSDPGATASDNYDGNLTGDIISFSNVNTEVAGTYSVIYSVTDSSGNETTVTRTVVVEYVDTQAPVISLSGAINIYLAIGGTYSEPGYSATDNLDGDITSNVVVSGSIDNSEPGTYQLTYSVSDAAGNAAIPKTRNVIIQDTLPPGITLIGASTMNIEVHTSFSDPGATAYDNYDGDISGNIIVGGDVVDRDATGSYYITYDVTDSSGNEATQVVRTVHVYDPRLQ